MQMQNEIAKIAKPKVYEYRRTVETDMGLIPMAIQVKFKVRPHKEGNVLMDMRTHIIGYEDTIYHEGFNIDIDFNDEAELREAADYYISRDIECQAECITATMQINSDPNLWGLIDRYGLIKPDDAKYDRLIKEIEGKKSR